MSDETLSKTEWDDDQIGGRKEAADYLTNYLIKRYEVKEKHGKGDSFVLSFKADWGFGKSFFIDRWSKDLQVADYTVVVFDAWANDFSDDPLLGFIVELNEVLSEKYREIAPLEKYVNDTISYGKRMLMPVGKIIAAAITKKVVGLGVDEFADLFADSQENGKEKNDSLSDLTELMLKEHTSKKESIRLFKEKLQALITELKVQNKRLPLFIFVDELDRCRPSYAIELLEAIKHLFKVPGVYFVISANLDQLAHSVAILYGAKFESARYLQRFFDQEYTLPKPDNWKFAKYLFEKFTLDEFTDSYTLIEYQAYQQSHNVTDSQAIFAIFSEAFELSLRDQEYVASTLETVLLNWPTRERIHLAYLLFLITIKQVSSSTFQEILEGKITDLSNFRAKVADCMRLDVTYKQVDENRFNDCSLISAVMEYLSAQQIPFRELGNKTNIGQYVKIYIELTNDSVRFQPTPRFHPIANYPNRVSQAGQLSKK